MKIIITVFSVTILLIVIVPLSLKAQKLFSPNSVSTINNNLLPYA